MVERKVITTILLAITIVLVGFVKINIINTKALSPMGTTEDNYAVVSKEFGKDFTEFIKDNSPIKIYAEDDIIVSINTTDYKITTDNPIIKFTKGIANNISQSTNYFKNKIDEFINNVNNDVNNTINPNEEIDSIIDGYIQKNNYKNVDTSQEKLDTTDVLGDIN